MLDAVFAQYLGHVVLDSTRHWPGGSVRNECWAVHLIAAMVHCEIVPKGQSKLGFALKEESQHSPLRGLQPKGFPSLYQDPNSRIIPAAIPFGLAANQNSRDLDHGQARLVP